MEDKEYGAWLRADPPSLLRKKVVKVSGSGNGKASARGPNAGTGDSARENGAIEGNQTVGQQDEQGGFDVNLDSGREEGEFLQQVSKISVILRNEDAFQNHLKEIDMELEGNLSTMQGAMEST